MKHDKCRNSEISCRRRRAKLPSTDTSVESRVNATCVSQYTENTRKSGQNPGNLVGSGEGVPHPPPPLPYHPIPGPMAVSPPARLVQVSTPPISYSQSLPRHNLIDSHGSSRSTPMRLHRTQRLLYLLCAVVHPPSGDLDMAFHSRIFFLLRAFLFRWRMWPLLALARGRVVRLAPLQLLQSLRLLHLLSLHGPHFPSLCCFDRKLERPRRVSSQRANRMEARW
jgi:hypothetical protein